MGDFDLTPADGEMLLTVKVLGQDRIEIAKRLLSLARDILIDGRGDHDPVGDEGSVYGGGVTAWKFSGEVRRG